MNITFFLQCSRFYHADLLFLPSVCPYVLPWFPPTQTDRRGWNLRNLRTYTVSCKIVRRPGFFFTPNSPKYDPGTNLQLTNFTAQGLMVKLTGLSCGVLFQELHEALDNPARKNFQRRCDWYEKLGIVDCIVLGTSILQHEQYGKVHSSSLPW